MAKLMIVYKISYSVVRMIPLLACALALKAKRPLGQARATLEYIVYNISLRALGRLRARAKESCMKN